MEPEMTLDRWVGLDPAQYRLPPVSRAAHPRGTPERAAADLHDRRETARILGAREEARQRLTARLRLWLRLHPADEHARDLLRVWATQTPSWRPCGEDTPRWRAERDARLAGVPDSAPLDRW